MRWLLIIVLAACFSCQGQDGKEHRVRHPELSRVDEQVRRSVENALEQWRVRLAQSKEPSQRAIAYAQLGQVYLAHHFDEAAADALTYATTHVTTNSHWLFYYACALERSFRLAEAEQALSGSLDIEEHPEARFLRASVRARQGDRDGALADIERLKDSLTDSVSESGATESDKPAERVGESAWFALEAELLAGQQRYVESAASLAQAIELDSAANALLVPAARLNTMLGNSKRARTLLNKAGTTQPAVKQPLAQALSALARGSAYYLERGQSWMRTRNFEQAMTDFATAADIAPSDYDARLAYGRSLEIVGQIEEAERQYHAALELRPQSAVAHYFLGSLYERQRQDEQSLEHYAMAVEVDPDYIPPVLALAHAYFRKQEYAQALEHYTLYAQAREGDLESRYYAGLAALALGDCEAGPRLFEEASSLNPHSLAALEGMARSFATCSQDPGQLSRAQDIAERLEQNRPDAAAAATLAMVHAALKDFESAIRLQELAIRRSSEDRVTGQRDRLTQYESSERSKVAWLPGDSVFDPPRLAMRVLQ
ncbi:MAG: tetratricopeptide repeat protein [Gammaproteobacteria bacterium]